MIQLGLNIIFVSQDSTAVVHFCTIFSSTTVGQIIHNNHNRLKCFIPQSCWILCSDWSESADQFSDSSSNSSCCSRWLFSVCCRVLFFTYVKWLDPFKEMNLSLLKGKKCHCSGFAEKGKWQCYWKARVSSEQMTSKCYCVIIYKSHVSVCSCLQHWFTRIRGERDV